MVVPITDLELPSTMRNDKIQIGDQFIFDRHFTTYDKVRCLRSVDRLFLSELHAVLDDGGDRRIPFGRSVIVDRTIFNRIRHEC